MAGRESNLTLSLNLPIFFPPVKGSNSISFILVQELENLKATPIEGATFRFHYNQ
jgi:hypothetical protein